MANKTTEITLNLFNVLHVLAPIQNGLTIGNIEKSINWMTRGQVVNVLNILETMGFVWCELQPHGRTGKKVYRLTEHCAIQCSSIAREYTNWA